MPLPPTPRNQSPWTPPPEPPPHPTGYPSQKKSFFFFKKKFVRVFVRVETSKIRRKLRNLLRPWGPCPYHLPPRNQSPWTPPSRALVPPPTPTGYPSKKIIFLLFFVRVRKTQVAKFAPSLGPVPRGLLFSVWTQPSCHPAPTPPATLSCNQGPWFTALSTRLSCNQGPWKFAPSRGPCPYHLPPRNHSPWTPPVPSPCTHPHPTGYPSKKIVFFLSVRVRNVKNTTQVAKFAPSLGARAPTTYPRRHHALGTPPRAPA